MPIKRSNRSLNGINRSFRSGGGDYWSDGIYERKVAANKIIMTNKTVTADRTLFSGLLERRK
jgi:hypothetical protein